MPHEPHQWTVIATILRDGQPTTEILHVMHRCHKGEAFARVEQYVGPNASVITMVAIRGIHKYEAYRPAYSKPTKEKCWEVMLDATTRLPPP